MVAWCEIRSLMERYINKELHWFQLKYEYNRPVDGHKDKSLENKVSSVKTELDELGECIMGYLESYCCPTKCIKVNDSLDMYVLAYCARWDTYRQLRYFMVPVKTNRIALEELSRYLGITLGGDSVMQFDPVNMYSIRKDVNNVVTYQVVDDEELRRLIMSRR